MIPGSAPRLAPAHAALLVMACVLAVAPWAPADAGETLADPTRPPDTGVLAGAPLPAGPVLQSVLISPERSLAVIDGATVPLGGRHGTATVVRITETEVELREGQTIRRLRLFPGVVRRAAGDGPAHSGSAGRGMKKRP